MLDRCDLVSGDFFEQVPGGADANVLKSVLHDWDDTRAIKILQNCRAVMSAQTKLLVIEPIILSDWQDFLSKFPDLMILVITEGGRERTEEEFRTLFAASDLKLTNVVNTGSRVGIVEAVQV